MDNITVKKFLLKKFPTKDYMDCPVPKHYWEIMEEYASLVSAAKEAAIKELVQGFADINSYLNDEKYFPVTPLELLYRIGNISQSLIQTHKQ